MKKTRAQQVRDDARRKAAQLIREHGPDTARRLATAQVKQAVNDVTYPMDGRIAIFAAILDILNAKTPGTAELRDGVTALEAK